MMSRLPIRIKMTLLYGVLTATLLLVFLPTLYFVMRSALMRSQTELLRLAYTQVATQLDLHDGEYALDEDATLPQGVGYQVSDASSGISLLRDRMPSVLRGLPYAPDQAREAEANGTRFLILDGREREDDLDVYIRVSTSLTAVDGALGTVRTVSMVGAPLLLVAASALGLWVAKRSLRPIDRIIHSARIVATGDLSERIASAPSRDEVGELTDMLNQMLEKLESSFISEKRFASDASHELRTPVAVILAYAESLAQDAEIHPDTQHSIHIILTEAQGMQRIIHQLLMITRGDDGHYPISMESVDMAEIVRTVAEQLVHLAQEKGIHIEVDTPDHMPLTGDQSLLTQLMLNLTENAVKYGRPDGHVSIKIEGAQDLYTLIVADDGIGIAPDALPHIFERFYRADAARDRSGTGLGLSIAKWIVDLHRGSINVQSQSGSGTSFSVTLPRA